MAYQITKTDVYGPVLAHEDHYDDGYRNNHPPTIGYHAFGWKYNKGDDLLSLEDQLGYNSALEAFAERWPDAGDSAVEAVPLIYMYASLEAAWEHVKEWDCKGVVEIDLDGCSERCVRDTFENAWCMRGPISNRQIIRYHARNFAS